MHIRIKTLILLMSISLSALAFNKTALADSLDSVAHLYASQIGSVKVEQIRENNGSYEIRTNATLGYLSISPELLDTLRHVAGRTLTGRNTARVKIFSDGEELSTLITSIHKPRTGKNTHIALPTVEPLVKNNSRAYAAPKGLDNRHVAVYGSHGIYYHQGLERWLWQRAKMFTTVEDLYTTGYIQPFLVPMLENAGAVVIQPRERDRQLHEVIVDDTEAATTGDWSTEPTGGWGPIPDGVLYEGENPFTFGGYRYALHKENHASLQYRPTLPEEGDYAVYVSYKTLPHSTDKAVYTVVHEGIRTEYLINQQMGGGTWVYVGTFHFGTDPQKNFVGLSSQSSAGKVVTSDAVRFGGGWGSIARCPQQDFIPNVPSAQEKGQSKRGRKADGKADETPVFNGIGVNEALREQTRDIAEVSGFPRWEEGARYWQQYSGIPDSVYNYTGGKNDYTDDYASRGRWINWLAGGSAAYPEGPGLGIPVEMGLAFHTDAGTTPMNEIIGTLVIYTGWDDEKQKEFPNGASRILARDYADYMQTQLVNDVRALYAPEWARRRLHNSSYAESRNPKVPTVLLEFLSHQNFADMKYGLDPSFRFVVSRAIYKSMLRFNHEQYGTPYVVQPLPVQDFRIRFAEGNNLTLTWRERLDSLEETAAPSYYVVYTRRAGEDWDNGQKVEGCELTLAVEPDLQYDYKVVAGNDGGISFPSEILTACKASQEKGRALIINGFTRVSAPDHFESADSTLAGFIPEHYGVGYGHEVTYIGEQHEFDRRLPWVTDDNCGFGTCYTDRQYISPVGNTFDYPCMHGRVLCSMGYSFVSSSASAVSAIPEGFTMVDLIMGKQKQIEIGTELVQKKYELFPQALRDALQAYKGNLLLSGAYIGSEMAGKDDKAFTGSVLHYAFAAGSASRSGIVNVQKALPKMQATLVMDVNETTLPCETPDGLNPQNGAVIAARYSDTRITAGIAYEGDRKQLVFGFPLESLEDFDSLYSACVSWLNQ